jgi:ribosomal protein S27E
VTVAAGERVAGLEAPQPPPESTDPTVACARCKSIEVYQLADGRVACRACGELLTVEYTEVQAG